MRIRDWLDSMDRTPDWLAERLTAAGRPVSRRSAYRWAKGDSIPRDPEHVRLIVELSGGSVRAEDVIFATSDPPARESCVA